MNKDKRNEQKLLEKLQANWKTARGKYESSFRKMSILDQTDKGEMWKAIGAKFPSYQILPDTNFIAYVKSNLTASIYTVAKSAQVMATADTDMELCENLNVALRNFWTNSNVGYLQLLAGERAALCNLGITQVGWNESYTVGAGDQLQKGTVSLKNVDPMKFMRDPFARDLDSAGWCMTYEDYHKSVILKQPSYREEFKKYMEVEEANTILDQAKKKSSIIPGSADGYYTIVIHWIRNKTGGIDEIHTVNNDWILMKKENIEPNMFPFALLYCNIPGEHPVGVSECQKAFANNVAYNLIDSIALTSEYKNQRPPKFINAASGLNVQAFAKHGDEANKTFIVNNNPKDVVHYQQFPQVSPAIPNMKMGLEAGIETITGVDGRYTGRDTGSIITTGGTEEMLNRVTVIDTPKIMLFEQYCSRLTDLILSNMVIHSPKRRYFYKLPNTTTWRTTEVNFPDIPNETLFNYEINISSDLPNNKQRVAQMANMLMEKQMQYNQDGTNVEIITVEEWLMFQDLPQKEFMLERMGIQRLNNAQELVSQVLYEFDALTKSGMTADQAIMMTANSMNQQMGAPNAMPGLTPDGIPAAQGMVPGASGPMSPAGPQFNPQM